MKLGPHGVSWLGDAGVGQYGVEKDVFGQWGAPGGFGSRLVCQREVVGECRRTQVLEVAKW